MTASAAQLQPLGDVVEFLDSRRKPVKASERVPGPYPYYGANGQQGTINDFIFDEPLVLLAEDGGHFFNPVRGIAYKISGKTWVNNHAHVLKPKNGLDIDYLCLVLKNMDVTKHLTGSTRAKLTKAGASRILVPVPAIDQQKRIAAILDAADALRAKRRETLAQLDTLLQSTFLEMFGSGETQAKVTLDSLAEKGRGNFSNGPFGSDLLTSELVDIGVPVVYIRDIRGGEYERVSSVFVTPSKAEQLKNCQIQSEDILIAKVGDPPGIAAVYPSSEPDAIITQDVIRLRADKLKLVPQYFVAYINSEYGRRLIRDITVEATRARFGLRDFKALQIPLPPIAQQEEFATIAQSVEQQKSRLRAHLDELGTLFASLQARAFSGEL